VSSVRPAETVAPDTCAPEAVPQEVSSVRPAETVAPDTCAPEAVPQEVSSVRPAETVALDTCAPEAVPQEVSKLDQPSEQEETASPTAPPVTEVQKPSVLREEPGVKASLPENNSSLDIEFLRKKAVSLLVEASDSGLLASLLNDSRNIADEANAKDSQATQVSLSTGTSRSVSQPEYIETIRLRSRSKLEAAFLDGSLPASLEKSTPAEDADMDAVRTSTAAALEPAANDGRLLEALQGAKPPRAAVVVEESQKTDIEALRKRALSQLNASAHDGRLSAALQSVKPSAAQGSAEDSGAATHETVDIDSLRREAMNILSQAVHDGRLNVALQDVTNGANATKSTAPAMEQEAACTQVKSHLESAVLDGRLEDAVNQAIAASPSEKEELDELRNRVMVQLEAAANDGSLQAAAQRTLATDVQNEGAAAKSEVAPSTASPSAPETEKPVCSHGAAELQKAAPPQEIKSCMENPEMDDLRKRMVYMFETACADGSLRRALEGLRDECPGASASP